MRLVKAESEHLSPPGEEAYFPHKLFQRIVEALVYAENLKDYVRIQFAEKYLDVYDDIRYSFFAAIKYVLPPSSYITAVLNMNQ